MDQIRVMARFSGITSHSRAAFKKAAAQALQLARQEKGTLQYDWYFNEDETVCVVSEAYADSDAVLAHVANLGDVFGALVAAGGGAQFELYGKPSAALVEATAGLDLSVYPAWFQGK